MRNSKYLFLIFILIFCGKAPAGGECRTGPSPENVQRYDQIFTAKLVLNKEKEFEFKTIKTYKGKQEHLMPYSWILSRDHIPPKNFAKDKVFLLASQTGKLEPIMKIVYLGACELVLPIEEAAEYIKVLEQPEANNTKPNK